MLGDISPQSVKIDSSAVVYPGRDHVTALSVKKFDGSKYVAADVSLLTRVVLVFPQLDPVVAFDSSITAGVFTWSGSTITVDLSDFSMPSSIQQSYLIVYDAQYLSGQVLVDDNSSVLEWDFRNISATGIVQPPVVELVGEAPADGQTYGRNNGVWVPIDDVVAGVSSVNGETGTVLLTTDDVPEGSLNLYFTNARASAAAPVQSVNGETGVVSLSAADVGADAAGTAAAAVAAHVADTTPHDVITQVDRFGFDTTAGLSAGVGELVWNATDATLDLGLPGGVTLQAGQEFLVRGLNNSGSTMLNGSAVYISGASGNRTVFSLARADQATADKTIGILTQDITNNQEGFCTLTGLVRNINTSAWGEGNELWLSATTFGGITNVQPASPNHSVSIGFVVRSHATQGSIFVRVSIIESLLDLHDVTITSPQDGDILVYNSATSTWLNEPNTGGSGEANTASNLGSGSGVFAQKVGVDLQFKSLVAGSGITLTPAASTITITGSGGGGAVDSVNGQTGVVVLDTDDIAEGATNLYFTNARASAAAPVQTVDGQTGAVVLTSSYAPFSHVGDTGAAHGAVTTSVNGFMSAADKTKLDGVATGATANQTDAFLLARANHTGTQVASTISDFSEAVDDRVSSLLVAGTNITLTYNDGANTLTIDAASGGGSLTNWTEAVSTAAPNATVPAVSFTATNAATNVDAVIRAKGTGATLAHVPDNTTTGGNKRGDQATDWQKIRGAASQVASGIYSVIGGGRNNTASANWAVVAGGNANTAGGQYSFIGSGENNQANANYCVVDGGQGNLANTNTHAVIAGGQNNTASGQHSAIAGGQASTASGASACIAGGVSNTASGQASSVLGGESNTAGGAYSSVPGGFYGTTRGLHGAEARGSGRFTALGDAQRGRYIQRRATTDATASVLSNDGAAPAATTRIVLPDNSAYGFRGNLIARNAANGDCSHWEFKGTIRRGANAAATALVAAVTPAVVSQDAGASTWVVTVTADTTNGALIITVTGVAATNIKWVADVETTEVVG